MWWILAGATGVAFLLTPLAGWLGGKLGLLDKPNELSIHRKPVPRVGGLAIFCAFAAVVAWALASGGLAGGELRPLWGLLIGASLVAAVGLIDDAYHISPVLKFLWQLAGAAVAVGLGVRFGTLPAPGISFAVTLVFLVGVSNALNLLDGMNGMATSVTATAALSMTALAMASGRLWVALLSLALAGACLGFLPHNYPRAKIFMGDVGSLFLGFVLAGLAVLLAQEPYDWSGFLSPLLVLGLPLVDTSLAIVRRFGRSQDVMGGDREHLYDLLSRRGLGDKRATLAMAGMGALLGGASLWVTRLGLFPALAVSVCAFAALVAFAAWLGALGARGSSIKRRSKPDVRQLVRRYGLALALDALVVIVGFYAAMLLRISYGPDFSRNAALVRQYLSSVTTYLPFVVFTYLLVNGFCGVYSRMWHYAGGQETLSIGIASVVSTAGVLVADMLLSAERPIPLSVVLVGGNLTMLGLVAWRYHRQIRSTMGRLQVLFPAPQAARNLGATQQDHDVLQERSAAGPHRTLIVGARREGRHLAMLMSVRGGDYEPVGFVDDHPAGLGLRVGRLKVLGDRQAIPDLIQEYNVDTVMVTSPPPSAQVLEDTLALCRDSKVRVKILPDVYADLLSDRDKDVLALPPAGVEETAGQQTLEGKGVLIAGAAG